VIFHFSRNFEKCNYLKWYLRGRFDTALKVIACGGTDRFLLKTH
jgi:hypothetical protein